MVTCRIFGIWCAFRNDEWFSVDPLLLSILYAESSRIRPHAEIPSRDLAIVQPIVEKYNGEILRVTGPSKARRLPKGVE